MRDPIVEKAVLDFENSVNLSVLKQSQIDKRNIKFHSGRKAQAGDCMLFGTLELFRKNGDCCFELITYHEDEIGAIYEMVSRKSTLCKIPHLRKINKNEKR